MWDMHRWCSRLVLAFPRPGSAMIPCGEWWEADLCLDVQQLEPAIPDLQEQVLAPHLALSVHFLQLLQGILGLLDSLRPQLTCQQVLRGEEKMQDWEKVWRRGSQVGMRRAGGWGKGSRGGRHVPGLLAGECQAIPIKQTSGACVMARGSQARRGLPSQGLRGCRRGFRTLEEGQSWPLTVQAS